MNRHSFIFRLLLALVSFAPCLSAQVLNVETKIFTRDGLSFNYPADWTLIDKSTPQAQHLSLSKPKTATLIMIVAYRDLISNKEQFQLALGTITNPYLDNIARNFAASGRSVERTYPCIEMEGVKVSGVRIHGISQNEQSTGEVYAFAKGRRFINLIYIRADKDASQGGVAWEAILKTLKISNPDATVASQPFSDKVVSGGVLNGKALRMPAPEYSGFARSARASGTVVVDVTVDENGNVISAKAVTGHPLLRKAAEDAALHTKFTPTRICEQPVKVNGSINYNFVL